MPKGRVRNQALDYVSPASYLSLASYLTTLSPVSPCVSRNGDDLKEKRRGPASLLDEPMMQRTEDQEKRNLAPYKDESFEEYGRLHASLDASVTDVADVVTLLGEGWWRGVEDSRKQWIQHHKCHS